MTIKVCHTTKLVEENYNPFSSNCKRIPNKISNRIKKTLNEFEFKEITYGMG